MKKTINRITAALLVFAMVLFSNSAQVLIKAQDSQMTESNKKMVCNSADNSASLYIDENGHFELKNNITNKSWYSIPQNPENDNISAGITVNDTRSELLIEYILREDVNTQYSSQKSNSESMCNNDAIKVTEIKNGFRVLYNFEEIGIKIPVEYKFVNSCFEASVVIDEIDEGKKSYLISLNLLPYFGAGNHEENGYLFVPDGSGAVAEFNKNIKPVKNYEKRVYGDDLAHSDDAKSSKEYDIKLPVFGIVTDNNGLMGVITEGDGAASISAKTGSDDIYYNSISSKLIYRICTKDDALYKKDRQGSLDGNYIYTLTSTEFGLKRYTVLYYLLSGEDANYSGMACKYKEYLADKYGLKKIKSSAKIGIRAYGAIEEKKNLFGISYYKKKALTTYNQMGEILDDLDRNGISNVAVQYVGWTGNGVTNRTLPLSANALSILGGSKELKALITAFAKDGYNMGVVPVPYGPHNTQKTYSSLSAQGYGSTRGAKDPSIAACYALFESKYVDNSSTKKRVPQAVLDAVQKNFATNPFIGYTGFKDSSGKSYTSVMFEIGQKIIRDGADPVSTINNNRQVVQNCITNSVSNK